MVIPNLILALLSYFKHVWHLFSSKKKVLLYFQLGQDLDLLLPIAVELKRVGVFPICSIAPRLFRDSPRTLASLRKHGLGWNSYAKFKWGNGRPELINILPSLKGISAIVTASESSAAAHASAQQLVIMAKSLRVASYTLQHGFESIGLTYDDKEFPIDKVEILSDRIFIWGHKPKLHAKISPSIASRCITAGCPKNYFDLEASLKLSERFRGQNIIAIFENLHWSRYSEEYISQFLLDIAAWAKAANDLTFIVKTHHAGKWATKNLRDSLEKNIVIADPSDPFWEPFTAPYLIKVAKGVITTPSTVALDAAMIKIPVAVLEYDLNLVAYSPLTKIRNRGDGLRFINSLRSNQELDSLVRLGEAFVAENSVYQDAVKRIVNTILNNIEA